MSSSPENEDPFELLGLPAVFDLHPREINRAFLAVASRLHPDLQRGDPDAAIRSAAVNRAKSVLEDPERRADALLARLGGPAREADRSLPTGFLAEMLETRENLEAAVAAEDAATVEQWRSWAEGRRRDHIQRASSLFASLREAAPPDTLSRIRAELNAWRYIERMLEQLAPGRGAAL